MSRPRSEKWCVVVACMAVLLTIVGCKKVPDDVVGVNDMAQLLADIHTAEAVVDIDMRDYPTDSAKQVLKQSVLMAHNVTQDQFDNSMMWYGRNIDKYIEVYDEVIKILEKRSQQAGVQMIQDARMADGDSVDVWGASRYVIVSPRNPSHMVTFDLPMDTATAMPGDSYTWRIKVVGTDAGSVRWHMLANYPDSTVEYINTVTTNSSVRSGWNEMTFITDSTRMAQRLRGIMEVSIPDQNEVWIDSISLIRKRVDPDRYRNRTRQKRYAEFYPPVPKPAVPDTTQSDTLSQTSTKVSD